MPGYSASIPISFSFRASGEEYTLESVTFTATLNVEVNEDYTEAACSISNPSYNAVPGNVTGLGFCDIMGICWYVAPQTHETPEYDIESNPDTVAMAVNQVYEYIPAVQDNMVYLCSYNDLTRDVYQVFGRSERTFSVSPGENVLLLNTFVRYAKSEDDGSARPPDACIAVIEVNNSWSITIDQVMESNYFPWARQDGQWLSCNRSGGYVQRRSGSWLDRTNSESDGDNTVHYYSGSWVKCPKIGAE